MFIGFQMRSLGALRASANNTIIGARNEGLSLDRPIALRLPGLGVKGLVALGSIGSGSFGCFALSFGRAFLLQSLGFFVCYFLRLHSLDSGIL